MQDLCILSHNSQVKRGMKIKSLNDIANEDLSNRFEEICSLLDMQRIASTIIRDWEQILHEIGGVTRASLCNTIIELNYDNSFKIIFKDYSNYLIGSRSSVINELGEYVLKKYGLDAHFVAQYKDKSCIYISNEELKSNILMDISVLD